jgi:hypothetical protein
VGKQYILSACVPRANQLAMFRFSCVRCPIIDFFVLFCSIAYGMVTAYLFWFSTIVSGILFLGSFGQPYFVMFNKVYMRGLYLDLGLVNLIKVILKPYIYLIYVCIRVCFFLVLLLFGFCWLGLYSFTETRLRMH